MYPNLTLLIQNNKPIIQFNQEKDISRNLHDLDEDLVKIIQSLGAKLNLVKSNENLQTILEICNEGNERFIEKIPNISKDKLSLAKFLHTELEKIENTRNRYTEFAKRKDVSQAVIDELIRNDSIDIYASLLEMIYNILIGRVVLHAQELGIGIIKLQDEIGFGRLREKMASELSKLDIELVVE